MGADILVSRDTFNPLLPLLTTKDWKAALKLIETGDIHVAKGSIVLQGFYDDDDGASKNNNHNTKQQRNKKNKNKNKKRVSSSTNSSSTATTTTTTATRVNALHIACHNHAPIAVVQALLDANPGLAQEPESSYKRLPLHIATLSKCPSRLTATILQAYPTAAASSDIHGRLPIHYASKDKRHGRLILRYLLQVHPPSVWNRDVKGFLPLHVACRSGMPMPILTTLLNAAPETVLTKTNNGATPIHCAKNYVLQDDSNGNGGGGEDNHHHHYTSVVETLKRLARETKERMDHGDEYLTDLKETSKNTRLSAGVVSSSSNFSCCASSMGEESGSVCSNFRLDFSGLVVQVPRSNNSPPPNEIDLDGGGGGGTVDTGVGIGIGIGGGHASNSTGFSLTNNDEEGEGGSSSESASSSD